MIQISNVCKSFGKTAALSGVSLSVEQGSIFGLVGSNGAGKSTLLRLLSGIYRPDGGEILVDGQPVYENQAVKAELRFLPDELWLPPQSSVLGFGKILAGLYPGWDQKYFERLCAMYPVNEKAAFRTLSKGNRRQAGLILALASRPKLLLLDESFDGLDPVVRHLTRKLIADLVSEGQTTVVLASHNLREMEDFCDSLALLHKGGLVLEQDLDGMKLLLHRFQAVFPKMPDISRLKEKICITGYEINGSLLSFVARGNEEEILAALDGFSPSFRESVPLSLEEVFISEMEAAGYDIDNILG